jgi:hypothetical protein
MTQTQAAAVAASAGEANGESKREVSSIAFPYSDLDGSVEIAVAIHQLQGSEAQVDQIAAHLRQSPKSSGFRTQIASAAKFNLVTANQGVLTLTSLGTRICDPKQEEGARAEAFLAVELYKKIYDQFKGGTLPPDKGLESAIVSMGVAQKQKERARQIFQRSAQQAGFFKFGTERLIMPAIKASTPAPAFTKDEPEDHEDSQEADKQRKPKGSGGGEEFHPFIQGLLKKLPPAETDWPMEGRSKWLEAAIKIFDLMYTDSEDSRRSISIELKKDSAKA